ncbi:tumor necrosis factor receptor superfamily member 5 [Mugil cephalus]|uniref:tumor necrosis factor receptor superfamily member 5 n=1 Tax=Mugil cephalus TaxID=48193 RepID=UPI001FB74134|nr:tumor necrosis factor receptor superfamily member 5 [Mugil cephalus]
MRLIGLFLLSALVGTATAQFQCDPQTQYLMNGQCCMLCGPGTSMTALGSCAEPQCKVCGEGEYQEQNTREPKCERQPYCDPNKNFKVVGVESKTQRTICMCKEGFHCSGEHCVSCVPHRTCEPGFMVSFAGNWTHDTVCQKCRDGYYSEERPSTTCKKMTECWTIEEPGTSTSDNKCGDRTHWIVLGVLLPGLLLAIGVFLFWFCRGKPRFSEVKDCFGSCREPQNEPLREIKPVEENTPVEDLEDPSLQEMVHLTENRNLVAQENGKTEILSCVSIGDSDMPVETLDSTSYGFNSTF